MGVTTLSRPSGRWSSVGASSMPAQDVTATVLPPMTCAVCTAGGLRPHLRVRNGVGAEGLIPTTDAYGKALDDIVRCSACGHMQLAHTPSDDELLPLYEEAEAYHYIAEEQGQRATARL